MRTCSFLGLCARAPTLSRVVSPRSRFPLPPAVSRRSGLSLLSLGFDAIFLVQHYVLYKHSTSSLLTSAEVDDDSREGDDSGERRSLLA